MIKSKIARLIALLLTIVLMCGLIACAKEQPDQSSGKTDQTKGEQSTDGSAANSGELEPYEFTYMTSVLEFGNGISDMASTESRVGKILKEKFNTTINFVVYAGDWFEKTVLMLSAGDYPEMLNLRRHEQVQQYINAGVAISLDPYLKDMPNFTSWCADQIPYWRTAANDGKLYKWESAYNQEWFYGEPQKDMLVRTDLLEQQGWPYLQTIDDYIKFCKKAIELNPTTEYGAKMTGIAAPFGEEWGLKYCAGNMLEKGKYNHEITTQVPTWDFITKKFVDRFTLDYNIASYRMWNRFYREGVLDKESFTDTIETITDKAIAGQVACIYYLTWIAEPLRLALTEAGHPEMEYIPMPIYLDEQVKNKDPRILVRAQTRVADARIVTNKCKNPERLMQIVDFFCTEEGTILAGWGEKGVDYFVENGKRIVNPKSVGAPADDPVFGSKAAFKNWLNLFPVTAACFDSKGLAFKSTGDETARKAQYSKRAKEAYEALGWGGDGMYPWMKDPNHPYEVIDGGAVSSVAIPANTEMGQLAEKLAQFRTKAAGKIIMANSEDEFNKYLEEATAEYMALQPSKVVDEANRLYNELLAHIESLKTN